VAKKSAQPSVACKRIELTSGHQSPHQSCSDLVSHSLVSVSNNGGAGQRQRKDPEGSENLCALPYCRAASAYTPRPFHSASSEICVIRLALVDRRLLLTYAPLSSAVLTHEPCGQDHSITCRFDRGSTPRTWLEHGDRATTGARRAQGDQHCPADNRSSRQRSEAGVVRLASKAFGGEAPSVRAARGPTGRTLLAPVTAVSAPVTRGVTFSSCGDPASELPFFLLLLVSCIPSSLSLPFLDALP
jgi:hypothetical protein